ncbi:MAG TPA: hypothetical protein VLX59_20030 [Acidimicrobiales bacterium]|nr:hypothetical protein [Acidimicrobiales bacterium]
MDPAVEKVGAGTPRHSDIGLVVGQRALHCTTPVRDDSVIRRRTARSSGGRDRVLGAFFTLALLVTICFEVPTGVAAPEAPLPAGRTPSSIAQMICRPKARHEIASVLGEIATVSRPTWVHHLYSCRYSYPTGSMVLSVKELSSWAQTKGYLRTLAEQMGKTQSLNGLGQAAIQTTDGSIIVRKDWKVLLVNSAGLPGEFGQPPTSSRAAAESVADVILGCWNGD